MVAANWLEIGLSGWITFIVALIIGGGSIVLLIRTRTSKQSNVRAGRDVAGGDIRKRKNTNSDDQSKRVDSVRSHQSDITAGGDVAGGDIHKNDE